MSSTMVMTADYDMIVSQSPPVYGYSSSPPAGFLTDYCNTRYESPRFTSAEMSSLSTPVSSRTNGMMLRHSKPNFRSNSFDRVDKLLSPLPKMPASAQPKRSCLVQRSNSDLTGLLEGKKLLEADDLSEPTSPTKNKKKVVFADDRGMSLTQIRIMSEPSCVPPVWSLRFLSQLTNEILENSEPWEIQFVQPASDYVEFSKRLETKCVSLENVVIKEKDGCVIGTVKVKNIAFEKTVFIRTSCDGWKTQEDIYCTYVQNRLNTAPPSTAIYVLYDTFSFKINLPPKSHKIEFCVCYQSDKREFWDSNDGKNYVIIKKLLVNLNKSLSLNDLNKQAAAKREEAKNRNNLKNNSMLDAMQTKIDAWSEFASWNHLDASTPYW